MVKITEKQYQEMRSKVIDRLNDLKFKVLIVEHPNQMPPSIYALGGYYDNFDWLEDLDWLENFEPNDELSDREILDFTLRLSDNYHYEIYFIEDVKKAKDFEDFLDTVYEEQGTHNTFGKDNDTFYGEVWNFYHNVKENY